MWQRSRRSMCERCLSDFRGPGFGSTSPQGRRDKTGELRTKIWGALWNPVGGHRNRALGPSRGQPEWWRCHAKATVNPRCLGGIPGRQPGTGVFPSQCGAPDHGGQHNNGGEGTVAERTKGLWPPLMHLCFGSKLLCT